MSALEHGTALVALRVAVTAGAAWLVWTGIDWPVFVDLLRRAEPARLATAGLVLAVQFAVMVWRWQVVIAILSGASVAAARLAVGLGRSMLIGQPLPSTIGGDIVRAVMLSSRVGAAVAARSVIADRIVALLVLVALVVALLPSFAGLIGTGPAFVALAAIALGSLAASLVLLAGGDRLSGLPFVGRHAVLVLADLRRVLGAGRASLLVLALSLATHLLGVVLIHELAAALATPITVLQCLVIVPPTLLVSAVPISLGGWGVREGALAAGFALVGVSSEAGVATSILFGLTGPLIGIVAEVAAPLVRRRESSGKDA